MNKKLINPWAWQDEFGFSQAVEISGHSRVLRCAGQTAVNENAEPQHEGDMAGQIGLALDNLETVLRGANMTLTNVVHLNLYTTDMDVFFQHFRVLVDRLQAANTQPSTTLLGVVRLFDPRLLIEIEATAVV